MLTIEIITSIGSILFGILLYWRESKSNRIYRFFNTLFYAKDLQMPADSKKGFIYKQSFLMRLVYLGFLYLLAVVIIQFFIPFNIGLVHVLAPSFLGTIVGTYVANFVFKSSQVIDTQGNSLVDAVKDSVEKGKDYINDLNPQESKIASQKEEQAIVKPKKSARQRLKDKGHL